MDHPVMDVLDKIRKFDTALEGASGDDEADAACAMRDAMLEYLRSNPERTVELADIIDEFDGEHHKEAKDESDDSDAGVLNAEPQTPVTVDITPRVLKTAEGAHKVNEALDALDQATSNLANSVSEFLDDWAAILRIALREDEPEAVLALEDALSYQKDRRKAQDRLLRVISGHDADPSEKQETATHEGKEEAHVR